MMEGDNQDKAFNSKIQYEAPSAELANALEPTQQLDRNFSLLSISAVGVVTGNTWAALGGSIVSTPLSRLSIYLLKIAEKAVAIFNGYEFQNCAGKRCL